MTTAPMTTAAVTTATGGGLVRRLMTAPRGGLVMTVAPVRTWKKMLKIKRKV